MARLAPSTCDRLVIARIAGVVPAITQADSHAWTVKYRCGVQRNRFAVESTPSAIVDNS
jgi:hypothetical protein